MLHEIDERVGFCVHGRSSCVQEWQRIKSQKARLTACASKSLAVVNQQDSHKDKAGTEQPALAS